MLKEIISISGEKGLHKIISRGKNVIIVESLEDKKRKPVFPTTNVSALEDITIFTQEKDGTPLSEVFRKIHEKEHGNPAIDHKSLKEPLIAYFSEVLPDYDREKVYESHIRKILNWYNILHKENLLKFEETKEESKEETIKESSITDAEVIEEKQTGQS